MLIYAKIYVKFSIWEAYKMSITKSYNKHTDTYYAYDTTYIWDDKLQKKVQKKVCIGKYDPETGDIIPNAKRGRPSKKAVISKAPQNDGQPGSHMEDTAANMGDELTAILSQLQEIEKSMAGITADLHALKEKMFSLQERLP